MPVLKGMAVLIDAPWLALVPAVLLAIVGRVRQARFATWMAVEWVVYMLYELGMKYRLLCSGDCNIRIDLLLIYPVLLDTTVLALVWAFWPRRAEA